MNLEKEITVMISCDYETLKEELRKEGFQEKGTYEVHDTYMMDQTIDLKAFEKLDLLQNCILVRDIVGIEKSLLYKDKKYAKNGDILEQKKIKCPISDCEKAIQFMNAIHYKCLFEIHDSCTVYANEKTELTIQQVNDEYLFLEIEDLVDTMDAKYSSIEEMIQDLESYHLSYDKSNYFVKKALIMLEKTLREKKEKL